MMVIIPILFTMALVTQSASACFSLYYVLKKGWDEINPDAKRVFNAIGWWFLPLDAGATGVFYLVLAILVPTGYMMIIFSICIGFNLGVIYRDYLAVKHYEKKLGMALRLWSSS